MTSDRTQASSTLHRGFRRNNGSILLSVVNESQGDTDHSVGGATDYAVKGKSS